MITGKVSPAVISFFLIGMIFFSLLQSIPSSGQTTGDHLEEIVFEHQTLHKETGTLFRSAFGDLIPGNGFTEMATCSRNGRITVTYGTDISWTTELVKHVYVNDVPTDPAEVYSLAAGDILPEREGDELVSVDTDNAVRIHSYNGGRWESETIWEYTNWLYEVAVADIIDTNNGPEIVVVGEDWDAVLLWRTSEGWEHEILFHDNHPLDCCIVGDVLEEDPGPEILVGGIDSNVTLIYGSPGNWTSRDIANAGSAVSDLTITDLDPDLPGKEIYASTFNGEIFRIHREDEDFGSDVVHYEGKYVYCLENGTVEGRETIAFASYNNRVALLYHEDDFKVKELYREDYIMAGTAIHDLDPYHKGNEIFGLSGLGYLTMIYHDDPGLDIVLPFDSTTASVNEAVDIPLIIKRKGGYDGPLELKPKIDGERVIIPPIPMTDQQIVYTFRFPGSDNPGRSLLEFEASGGDTLVSKKLNITITDDHRPVSFENIEYNGTIGQDRQGTFDLNVLSEQDVGSPFILEAYRLPNGLEIELNRSVVDPRGTPIPVSCTVKVYPGAGLSEQLFFLVGSSTDNRRRAVTFSIDVEPVSVSDFEMFVDSYGLTLNQGGKENITLSLISINGFSDRVSISIAENIDDIETTFSETEVTPPAEIVLSVTILEDDGPYFLFIKGESNSIKKETILRIDTDPPLKELLINGSGDSLELDFADEDMLEGSIVLTLTPVNGIVDLDSIKVEGLQNGSELEMDPPGMARIPYEVDLVLTLRSPENMTVENIILNFTSEDGYWTHEIPVVYPDVGTDENDEGGPTWIVVVILVGLFLLAAGILIYTRSTNPLNRNVDVPDDHGIGEGPDRSGKARKRPSGGSGGLDRFRGGRK